MLSFFSFFSLYAFRCTVDRLEMEGPADQQVPSQILFAMVLTKSPMKGIYFSPLVPRCLKDVGTLALYEISAKVTKRWGCCSSCQINWVR